MVHIIPQVKIVCFRIAKMTLPGGFNQTNHVCVCVCCNVIFFCVNVARGLRKMRKIEIIISTKRKEDTGQSESKTS